MWPAGTSWRRQECHYRPHSACHSLDDRRVRHRPGGLPSVTLGFLLSDSNASQYHWAKWKERSHGTAEIMRRAAAHLDFDHHQPLDVWVHVADVGYPELPLPMHPASGITLETVASTREAAARLFPDYSFAGWKAIGFRTEDRLRTFTERLLLAGQQPPVRPLRPQAVFVGNENMHPVRAQLRALAAAQPGLLDVRHVPPFDADGAREFPSEYVPFEKLSEFSAILDAPGGGWSGRLKFLPLLQRPLLVLDRAAWGWADGHVLEPYTHYRPVRASISGDHVGQRYLLDQQDLLTQLQWCRANPAEAAAMVRRALARALEVFTDDGVDEQALKVLRAAAIERGLLAPGGRERVAMLHGHFGHPSHGEL